LFLFFSHQFHNFSLNVFFAGKLKAFLSSQQKNSRKNWILQHFSWLKKFYSRFINKLYFKVSSSHHFF
jgi:hypothetical protein